MVRFDKADRKIDVVRPYLEAASGPGVVAIGTAQEFQWVFSVTCPARAGRRCSVRQRPIAGVGLLLLRRDAEFGPGFVKLCTYFPYPAKVWVNGHEWAKRQASNAGIGLQRAGQRIRDV